MANPTPSTFALTTEQQGWPSSSVDARSWAQLQQELLDDLNRPDLTAIVVRYLRDAILHWRRQPFFFSNRDNTSNTGLTWQASWFWTIGATIAVTISSTTYAFVACTEGLSGANAPAWPTTVLTPPAVGVLIDQTFPGAVLDNQVVWANAGVWAGPSQSGSGYDQGGESNYFTQLTTVPNLHRYRPPLDFIAPQEVEILVAGNRYHLQQEDHRKIEEYDVVRPAYSSNYPVYYAYYKQQFYLWPYPSLFAPIWLFYRGAAPVPVNGTDVNFWTTEGADLIKAWASGMINKRVIRDAEAAREDFDAAKEALTALRRQGIAQQFNGPLPTDGW